MPYLGQDGSYSICGFAAASLFYFQKDIRDININEAAILVGILPAPAAYRPDKSPAKAQQKRDRVLKIMAGNGWNVSDALESAIPIASVSPLGQFRFTAFAQASLSWLEDHLETQTLGFHSTGLQVFTSLDVVLQERTEKIFTDKLRFFP